jgi:glycine cleavage system H protein
MTDETYPAELRYHPEHAWARVDGTTATFGITWYAQDTLREIAFFDPPPVGHRVTKDQPYAEIESVKAVSDLYAPLSGEVVRVNEVLADAAATVNEDPYGRGWLVEVRLSDPAEVERLMDAAEYRSTITS